MYFYLEKIFASVMRCRYLSYDQAIFNNQRSPKTFLSINNINDNNNTNINDG